MHIFPLWTILINTGSKQKSCLITFSQLGVVEARQPQAEPGEQSAT